jgi:hypothetical protein
MVGQIGPILVHQGSDLLEFPPVGDETVRLEGVLYVDDPGCAFAGEYAYHVEAHSVEFRVSFGEIPFGQRSDGGLLARGDGFERIAEAHSPA